MPANADTAIAARIACFIMSISPFQAKRFNRLSLSQRPKSFGPRGCFMPAKLVVLLRPPMKATLQTRALKALKWIGAILSILDFLPKMPENNDSTAEMDVSL
jgi:hypothetical protein